MTIVVSTPYMDEAVQCDRIALIQNGKFLTIDTPEGIVDKYTETLWAVKSNKMHKLLTDLREIPGVLSAFGFGETHHITVDKNLLTIEKLKERLNEEGHKNVIVTEIRPTIEDCFMNLQN